MESEFYMVRPKHQIQTIINIDFVCFYLLCMSLVHNNGCGGMCFKGEIFILKSSNIMNNNPDFNIINYYKAYKKRK